MVLLFCTHNSRFNCSCPLRIPSMSTIQGQILEVSVICCTRLRKTEWLTTQNPYVILQYSTSKYRTRTHRAGGTNPIFQEEFKFTLIEGLRELQVEVWNSHNLRRDYFIGSGMVPLQGVLSGGVDNTEWPLYIQNGQNGRRNAGNIKLMMRYAPPPAYQY